MNSSHLKRAVRCTKYPAYAMSGKKLHPEGWIIGSPTCFQWPIPRPVTFNLHDTSLTSVPRLPFRMITVLEILKGVLLRGAMGGFEYLAIDKPKAYIFGFLIICENLTRVLIYLKISIFCLPLVRVKSCDKKVYFFQQ